MIGVPFSPPAPSPDPRPRRAPRVRRHLGRLLVAIGALTLPACDDPNALEVLRVVGALELGVRQAQIPDTMTAVVPSEITVLDKWWHLRAGRRHRGRHHR